MMFTNIEMAFYIPYSTSPYTKKMTSGMSDLFFFHPPMNREAIVKAASKMTSTHDLLVLLNRIKMDELGDKGHPFTMPQLNYFINPKRNKDHYRTFTIPKKSGGVRTISAPERMLKSMLIYTNRILQAFYEAPEYVTGFVPGRSVVDNAEQHVGMNYVFNTDLKDFFPSIPQARVWGALKSRPFCFDEKVASSIAGLCCSEITVGEETRFALPQGSPCSPILTNIVCHNLDWKLKGLARRFRLQYSRYADDITFSSNHNVYQADGEFMTEFRRIVAEQRFTINEKKTRLQKRGARQDVTGLVVSDRVNVAREYIRDLDNLLYIWEHHGHNSAFAKFIARYTPKQKRDNGEPDMAAVIQGKLMYLRMVKGEDSPVWRRLQKRFNRLADRKESVGGTDIVYLHSYSIEAFEKALGCFIVWYKTYAPEHTDDSDALKTMFMSPHFTINGREYHVSLSKYSETRVKHILEGGSEEELTKFKQRFQIAWCKKMLRKDDEVIESPPFWMIYRGLRKNKFPVLEIKDPSVLTDITASEFFPDESSDFGEEKSVGLSTDEMLDALVDSGFDLNTLEQWEKTRKSN